MRFKDYTNPETKDNRIYSVKDLLDMTLREIKRKKAEVVAQHRAIGIPTTNELKASGNV